MIVKRFQGRVVKRMRRVPEGILLTFLSGTPDERGEQITISQAEWDRHGTSTYEDTTLADLRRRQSAE